MARYSAKGPQWDAQRLRVLERDGWLCTSCGKPLEGRDATVDHIHPISLQPGHDYADHELLAMCRSCNGRKSDRLIARLPYFARSWLPGGLTG